jgi:PAS domain S-box-containing protein
MLDKTDSFRQEFETATQHLATLRRQLDPLPDAQGTPHPALEGLASALLALSQAHGELSRQNEACRARCQDLERERTYYRDVFEHAPHARVLTDLSGAIQVANVPASTLLRASQDSLAGQPLAAFLPEQDREAFCLNLAQLQTGGVLQDWEVHLQPASGDAVPASLDAVPVHDLEHRLEGFQWLLRDISRQAQAEDALLRSEHLLRSFMEQYQDGVALTDEHGTVVEWNQAMEQITGLSAAEACGWPIWDVQFRLSSEAERTPAAYEQLRSSLQELLRTGQAPWLGRALEREYARRDGSVRVLRGAVFPIRSDRGFMLGSVTRDVTERRRAEEEREQLLAQATLDRQRTEQLAESLESERSTFHVVIESTHTQLVPR